MDLDATLRELPLTVDRISKAISEICEVPVQDDVRISIKSISPIRPDDVYGGYRVKLMAAYDTIETPLAVDISTGDVITPRAVKYYLNGIFNEKWRDDSEI